MWGIEDRTALVTGGAGGLGKDICIALSNAGARVIVHDLPNANRDDLCDEINANKPRNPAITIAGDLSDLNQVAEDMSALIASETPTILVNNAAINPRAPIDAYDIDYFARIQTINAHSAFLLCQLLLPGMKERGGGAIVNITSQTFAGNVSEMVPYVFSKGSLLGMTRALAREAGPFNVRVNAVSPGAIPTELERQVWGDRLDQLDAEVISKQSLKFRGSSEDVANAVLFLVSKRSSFITGHELNVNGGWYMG